MSFKFLARIILVIVLTATTAAWLKMTVPHLSIGYFPLWKGESLRNIAGIFISMALLELYYLGYMYLLASLGFVLAARKWVISKDKQALASALSAAVAAGSYALYEVNFYWRATRIYEAHGGTGKPWYNWIADPEDWQLLLIYTIAGAVGGWFYWYLIYRRTTTLRRSKQTTL